MLLEVVELCLLSDDLTSELDELLLLVIGFKLSDFELERRDLIGESADSLSILEFSLAADSVILNSFDEEVLVVLFSLFLYLVHVLKVLSELLESLGDVGSLFVLSFDDLAFEFLILLVFSV